MCDLRIVLLGKNITENSRVGNFILGRAAFESEAPSADVELHIEREKGKLQIREITVINAPQLLIPDLSSSQITQTVKEIVNLSAPGPHVIIIILQQNHFTEKDRNRVTNVLNEFSEEAIKHTLVLTKEKEINNNCFHQLIQECGGGHLQFDQQKSGCQSEILERTEKIFKKVDVQYLLCGAHRETGQTSWEEQQIRSEGLIQAEKEGSDQEDGKIKHQHQNSNLYLRGSSNDLRIVLLGKTGVGKSATGNTILSREAFEEDISKDSVTIECQRETADVDGRFITVIDTPGLFDTKLSQEEIRREITNCISMTLPGPHVFLLLISVGRFTEEEENTVKKIQETFGENSLKYTIVLFTRGDGLKQKKKTIEEFLGEPGSSLMNLIDQCGNRYHVFNNNETEDRTQVTELLQKINDMVMENGGSYYSCKIFRQMEREKQEAQMKMLMNQVEQLKREREELLTKHEEEKDKMKMKLEKEKLNYEVEKKKREEEFEKEQKKWEDIYKIFKEEQDEIKREKADIQTKHNAEIEKMKTKMEEEKQHHDTDKRKREEEYITKQDKYEEKIEKEKQKREEEYEKMKEKQLNVTDKCNEKIKIEREEMKREKEKIEGEKEDLQAKHKEEIKEMKTKMEEERRNHDAEKRRIEEDFKQKEEDYRTKQDKYEDKIEKQKQKREEEKEKMKEKQQNIIEQCDEKIKIEREEIKRVKERIEKEKEDLQAKHKAEIEEMKTKMEEEKHNCETEKKRREEEFKQKEEEYRTKQEKYEEKVEKERQRREEEHEKMKEKEQNIIDQCYEKIKIEREEMKREKERIEGYLQVKHKEEIEEMKRKMEEERQNHDAKIRKREEELKQKKEDYRTKQEKYEEKIEKQKQKREEESDQCNGKIKMMREKIKKEMEKLEGEKEDLQAKHKEEIEEMKNRMEEDRRNYDIEMRGIVKEFKQKEEEYRTKQKRYEEKIEKEKQKRKEESAKIEKERNITDKCYEQIKTEREEMKREKERIEREKEDLETRYKEEIEEMKTKMEEKRQNHDTERRRREENLNENAKMMEQMQKHIKEMVLQMEDIEKKREEEKLSFAKQYEMLAKEIQKEKSLREQCTQYENRIKLLEKQKAELLRLKPADYEEDREIEIEDMKMCCSILQRDESGQNPKLKENKQDQLKELYDRLDLTKRQESKLRAAEILDIRMFQAHEPQENEMINSFLQKMINVDYRVRYTVTKYRKKGDQNTDAAKKEGKEKEANYKPDIHPMDVQMAVFHCADSFLKQLMVTKLSQCQYALPLLVPDPFTQQIEFPLWTFRQINKSWKMKTTNNETISQTQPIYKAETPMVFFFRFGCVSSSKSQLVNSLINEKHNTFFHRNCSGSSRTRLLMDGVVEIAWYCPSGRNTDSFDDCVAFCNLHGDAAASEKQFEILTSMSSVNVLFLPDFGQKNHYKGLVKSLFKSPQPLICLLTDNNCDKTELGNEKFIFGLLNKNQSDISNQIGETIRETLQKKTFRLEDVTKHSGIRVDEEDPECQRGKQAALKIMNLLRGKDPSTVKETILPCQGKLWHDWSKINKELHRLQGENLEEDNSNKLKKMREIREKQVAKGLSEFMKTFIEQLKSQKDREKNYFIRWMINLLENFTAEKLCEIHKEHTVKWHEVSALKTMPDREDQLQTEEAKLENISEQINRTKFGLEHIVRECGQIYESHSSVKKNKEGLQFDFRCLPSLAAEMMISGFPLELMDGDAAHVPLTWVSAVLGELVKELGDQRLFVLSVLGIQSSGKSTMLNALFGLQFAVSAGRCTRGAFMQLIRVSDEMKTEINVDYMLVVDTEGLRAPELSRRSATHHDNELATFFVGVGNMTLINIFGENQSEMQDILQIVVQAFMRMKKIKLNPSCMFVHQNVTDITAGEKNTEGRRRLVEKLDEMTKKAAKEEDCDAERFNDVIKFDVQKDVKYFPQLWEGSPPMAPLNPNYCESILELKNTILTHASQSDGIMLTQLREQIKNLWEALLNEQFVFSFKNPLEIATYKRLETEYSKWTRSLRSAMLEIEQKLHDKIKNEAIYNVDETDLQTELRAKSEEVKKKMSEFFANDKDSNTLNQWKASFKIKISQLQENIVRETMRKLNGVQQCHLKKKTQCENTLFEKSKELALSFKGKAMNEKTMKTQFDAFWKQQTAEIIRDTHLVTDIDILRDLKKLLRESYSSFPLDNMTERSQHKDMFYLATYSEYVQLKKSSLFVNTVIKMRKDLVVRNLSKDEEAQIRTLISDISEHTDKMIQSYNIGKIGYNISCIQKLLDYIKTRIRQHEEEPSVNYVFKNEFFVDLSFFIGHKSNKQFTDEYIIFREANDPVLYFERKGEEFDRIFQKYCKGASSTTIYGQFVCNKLKEPIQQSVYKTTARALADEMRTNCESLNGNRSNLEKHILKTLAEEQDFDAFMRYINNPREHFKSFIRDEVRQYITERFEKSVRPKMENNIKLLQQQIMNGVQESSKHVQGTDGDVGLWLSLFTQQLFGLLVFSESDLIEVNQDGVDVSFLEDVMVQELPSIMSDICSKFRHATFIVTLEPTDRPDEILIDHFCQCCWVQCPFCAAICTNTIEDHPGDHSVPFHRIFGLNGCCYIGTTNLDIEICTSAVASDRSFLNSSNESILWKEYRKAGPEYASWSITPDLSELPYWKWFVCRFQQEIEKHYKKTFQGSGRIPDKWRKYTQEEAVKSLNKYI